MGDVSVAASASAAPTSLSLAHAPPPLPCLPLALCPLYPPPVTALKLACWVNTMEKRNFSSPYETKDCEVGACMPAAPGC